MWKAYIQSLPLPGRMTGEGAQLGYGTLLLNPLLWPPTGKDSSTPTGPLTVWDVCQTVAELLRAFLTGRQSRYCVRRSSFPVLRALGTVFALVKTVDSTRIYILTQVNTRHTETWVFRDSVGTLGEGVSRSPALTVLSSP